MQDVSVKSKSEIPDVLAYLVALELYRLNGMSFAFQRAVIDERIARDRLQSAALSGGIVAGLVKSSIDADWVSMPVALQLRWHQSHSIDIKRGRLDCQSHMLCFVPYSTEVRYRTLVPYGSILLILQTLDPLYVMPPYSIA